MQSGSAHHRCASGLVGPTHLSFYSECLHITIPNYNPEGYNEKLYSTDVDGTNGSALQGFHSQEYEEINELRRESALAVAS